MRPGGKSIWESPFFETPNLSFEERVGNVACELRHLTKGTAAFNCASHKKKVVELASHKTNFSELASHKKN